VRWGPGVDRPLIHSFLSGHLRQPCRQSSPLGALLLLVCAGTFRELLALWRVRLRRCGRFACSPGPACWRWAASPRSWRQADNPFRGAFGVPILEAACCCMGLLLFSMARGAGDHRLAALPAPACERQPWWPVLLAVQAITGSRGLLGLPLSRSGSVQGSSAPPHPFPRPAS